MNSAPQSTEPDLAADTRLPYRAKLAPEPLGSEAVRSLMRLANLQFSPRMMTALLTHFDWDAPRIFVAADLEFRRYTGDSCHSSLLKTRRSSCTGCRPSSGGGWRRPALRYCWLIVRTTPNSSSISGSALPCYLCEAPLIDADQSGGRCSAEIARSATPYGMNVAERLSCELCRAGCNGG